jgi:hypothetical protein
MTSQSSVSTPTDDFDALYDEIQTKGPNHPDIVKIMNRKSDDEIDRYCEYEASRMGINMRIACLTYDYERGYRVGDDSTYPSQKHTFILTGNNWRQIDDNCIEGLDGNGGETLLAHLNADGNFAAIAIKNSDDEFLYSVLYLT